MARLITPLDSHKGETYTKLVREELEIGEIDNLLELLTVLMRKG
jgi:hypothetical protein